MTKKVSMQTIAENTGLSKSVVSRALAGKYGVSEHSKALVWSEAARLGYPLKAKNMLKLGNNTITVTGDMTSGWIQGGDGDDVITIYGVMANNSAISGNAGDDVITVATMTGGGIASGFVGHNTITIGMLNADSVQGTGGCEIYLQGDSLSPGSNSLQIDTLSLGGGGYIWVQCNANSSDTIIFSNLDTLSGHGQTMTINGFNGADDYLDLQEVYNSNGWSWNFAQQTATAWSITAFDGATSMLEIYIYGTNLDNPAAILV